eukprot:1839952-Pleurochrysis_carterae.AAC.2
MSRNEPPRTGPQLNVSRSRGPRRKAWGRSRGRGQSAPESADTRRFGAAGQRQRYKEAAGGKPVHTMRVRLRRTPALPRGHEARDRRD